MRQLIELIDVSMKTDVFPSKNAPSSNGELPLPLDHGGIALSQADIGRLFDLTRSRVNQLVRGGTLSTLPNGKLSPSVAAGELIRSDPAGSRSKVLIEIRRQIQTAEARATAALARAAAAEARATRAAHHLRRLAVMLIQSERRLLHLDVALEGRISDDEIFEVLDCAFALAAAEPPLSALDELDEDTRGEIIAALSLAEPPPPPADQPEITA